MQYKQLPTSVGGTQQIVIGQQYIKSYQKTNFNGFKQLNKQLSISSNSRKVLQYALVKLPDMITLEEVEAVATSRGLVLKKDLKGPVYSFELRDGSINGMLVADTDGFFIPAPIKYMHCDTLRIYNRRVNPEDRVRVRRDVYGLGPIMGAAIFALGNQYGCTWAEILSVDDDDDWAPRLVRYYEFFGFKEKYQITGTKMADYPQQMVWGAIGTLMELDILAFLNKWTPKLRRELYGDRYREEGGVQMLET